MSLAWIGVTSLLLYYTWNKVVAAMTTLKKVKFIQSLLVVATIFVFCAPCFYKGYKKGGCQLGSKQCCAKSSHQCCDKKCDKCEGKTCDKCDGNTCEKCHGDKGDKKGPCPYSSSHKGDTNSNNEKTESAKK